MKNISVSELRELLDPLDKKETLLVDVRISEQYRLGHMPGSVNIPLEKLEERVEELRIYKEVYIYCNSGNRSRMAYDVLVSKKLLDGEVMNVEGGLNEWMRLRFPVDRTF